MEVANYRKLSKDERLRLLGEVKRVLGEESLFGGMTDGRGVDEDESLLNLSGDGDDDDEEEEDTAFYTDAYTEEGESTAFYTDGYTEGESTAFYTEGEDTTAFYTEGESTAFYTEGDRTFDTTEGDRTFDTADTTSAFTSRTEESTEDSSGSLDWDDIKRKNYRRRLHSNSRLAREEDEHEEEEDDENNIFDAAGYCMSYLCNGNEVCNTDEEELSRDRHRRGRRRKDEGGHRRGKGYDKAKRRVREMMEDMDGETTFDDDDEDKTFDDTLEATAATSGIATAATSVLFKQYRKG